MAKPKRTPIRSSRKPKREPKKVKADPRAEYEAAMKGTGVVEALTFADDDCIAHVKLHISTGSLALDRLLNGRGIPCGRITEFFGPPHIGKSTLLDQLFGSVQKIGGFAALADVESSRDRRYTAALGVDVNKLHYLQFHDVCGEKGHEEDHGSTVEAVTIAVAESIQFWKTKYPATPVIIGWDSLGSTKTREEATKDFGATRSPGAAARVMRMFQRQIPEMLGGTNIALVVLNHEYQKIAMGGGAQYAGPKKETYGGEALRLAASIRVQLFSAGDYVKRSDGTILGKMVTAKVVKNRLGSSPIEADIALLNGTGTNNVIEVYEHLRKKGIIQVSGAWAALNLDGTIYKFQGWSGLNDKCLEDPALFAKLVSVYQGA
jgi:recombination protein RecA